MDYLHFISNEEDYIPACRLFGEKKKIEFWVTNV